MNSDQKKAFEQFRQSAHYTLIINELRARLDDARTVHESVTDKETPCQHRWVQGRVSAFKEICAIFEAGRPDN